MRKALKILLITVSAILLLTTAAAAIFLLRFDANHYRDDLTALVEKQTGREFSINGDIRLAASLVPTLAVEKVSLGNPAWATDPSMLALDRLEIQIELLPLFDGQLLIQHIVLIRPHLNLETGPAGTANWQFVFPDNESDQKVEPAPELTLPDIEIRDIRIEQATVSYHDADLRQPFMLAVDHLGIRAQGFDMPLQLDLAATYKTLPLEISGTVGSFEQLFASTPFPLALAINADTIEGKIEGRIENPSAMTGITARLQFEAASLADLKPVTGGPLLNLGPVHISGQFQGEFPDFRIDEFRARVAETDLQGTAIYKQAAGRPTLTANLHSERLNLVPFQSEENNNKQKDSNVFSSQELNLQWLRPVDAQVMLQAGRLLSRDVEFRDLQLQASLSGGDLRLTSTAGMAAGELVTDIRLNVAGKIPKLDARVDITNMLTERLPAFRQEPVIRDGRTNVHFRGRGAGPSPAAIAAGLNGKLLVTVSDGELLNNVADIAGTDLLFSTFRMLNPLSEQEQASKLICGVLNFEIIDGIARARDGIAMQTAKVNVLGSGVVNLKTEAIDFRAKPKAREGLGINLAQLSDVMYIGGTLANPRAAADMKGALKTAGTVGAAVATGGLSLFAQGVFSRTFATDDPCGVALGKREPLEAATETNNAAPQATVPADQTEAEDKNLLQKAGDKLKGVFKGLFGK